MGAVAYIGVFVIVGLALGWMRVTSGVGSVVRGACACFACASKRKPCHIVSVESRRVRYGSELIGVKLDRNAVNREPVENMLALQKAVACRQEVDEDEYHKV
ncbi:uncharacterized protein UV8b_01857 [Ustilaginoidea virens]|uniref:Uncharacterized protein n=1 Tax=Ustilaginoidea virens TaxID=1159556 RepID=A0A8E5MFK8_USTVR|nr:uncharacterized protein UV8b_01857 [Ustilaginoidea virens]QUC17616.1 hypothetical protein UV8b_01857 [Ustilaginoidea virens]